MGNQDVVAIGCASFLGDLSIINVKSARSVFMRLRNCSNCGSQVAHDAEQCPKCGTLTSKGRKLGEKELFNCKVCDAELSISQQVSKSYYSTTVNGTSSSGTSITINPCPNCGTKKPIDTISANFAVAPFRSTAIIVGLAIFAVIMWGFWHALGG